MIILVGSLKELFRYALPSNGLTAVCDNHDGVSVIGRSLSVDDGSFNRPSRDLIPETNGGN